MNETIIPLPDQLDLFDRPPASAPYQRHSATSRAAAVAIKPHMSDQQERILAWLLARGPEGGTDAEIAAGTGIVGDAVRPRRGELAAAGRVRAAGFRRSTASGRSATVWLAVPE